MSLLILRYAISPLGGKSGKLRTEGPASAAISLRTRATTGVRAFRRATFEDAQGYHTGLFRVHIGNEGESGEFLSRFRADQGQKEVLQPFALLDSEILELHSHAIVADDAQDSHGQ